MSDTAGPQAWGLWNESLKDWFNPGAWVVTPFPVAEDPTLPGQRPRD